MDLYLHNTLTREKERFQPQDPARVRVYVCGPTVYQRIHIGNARPLVVFDVLFRLLRHLYGEEHVTYVRNITDIDDKIIDQARANGESIAALTERTTAQFHDDCRALGLLPPTHEPRATEHIPDMIRLIGTLIERGHAYAAEGHVLFNVPSMPEYGRLSGRNRDEQIAGARVDVAPYKRDPADFVLWKPSTGDQPGWDSPWSHGRPGWHIECSAMAERWLGVPFDIHGGGLDLIFPHHENEIAQTEAGRGRPLARMWMHNGMIRFGEEKMAKSVGNITTLSDALELVGRDALILYLLGGHYRQPLAFSEERLEEARQSTRRIEEFARLVSRGEREDGEPAPEVSALREEFLSALRDDFNTPEALAALFKLVSEGNRRLAGGEDLPGAGAVLTEMLTLLGLERLRELEWEVDEDALRLAQEREDARLARDFDRADEIRRELLERGWEVRDTPDGPELGPTGS